MELLYRLRALQSSGGSLPSLALSMIGPPHLQRAHQQHLSSQMCLLCSQPLCTTDATLGGPRGGVSPLHPEATGLHVQLRLRGIDALALGSASNSQFFKLFKPPCSFTRKSLCSQLTLGRPWGFLLPAQRFQRGHLCNGNLVK